MKIKYKYGKMRKHWSELGRDGRLAELCKVWDNVVLLLDGEIAGVSKFLPAMDMTEKRASQWKGREDIIDAIVCAWVGICAIEGNASSFGNEDAAIWVPKSSVVSYI
jgi:predicted RNase H-like nuclease